MHKILNFGSINIDNVYQIPYFPRPGETINSISYSILAGGKGANQTVALARAGINVFHAGKIGEDGVWVKEKLEKTGIDTTYVKVCSIPTGHAIIQVTENGQNTITLFSGANRALTKEEVDEVLKNFSAGDYILLQNETNLVDYIIDCAYDKKMKIIFNPSPYSAKVKDLKFEKIYLLFMNPNEGYEITGKKLHQKIIEEMVERYPEIKVILTLGKLGAIYKDKETMLHTPARSVTPIDHTGARDTFIGYFLSSFIKGEKLEDCMRIANIAASICIRNQGAIDSIPFWDEVQKCLSLH